LRPAEHTAKSTSNSSTGLVATLSNLFRSKGTGAPSSHRLRSTLAILALVIAAFSLTTAPVTAA